MYDLLLIHVHLATMENGRYGLISEAALAVKDGLIAWRGSMRELAGAPESLAREVIDAQGALVTPGLIDCHTHLVFGRNRAQEWEARLNGKSYADIAREGGGILSTVRMTREASEDALFAQAKPRLQALMREGVTTVEIKSGYGLDVDSELKMLRVARRLAQELPVRVLTTFLGAHTLPPEYKNNRGAYVRLLCEEMLPRIAQEKLADAVDGFCETIGFTPEEIETLFNAARRLGLRVKLHAEQLSDSNGAALAARFQALSADHLEHVSEDGVRAMAQAGTVAVLLPGAFYFLKETHKPPIALFRKHGVPMALATDCNPGTSPCTSLLLMLNMGCTLFDLTPEEALAGITMHAAKALGLESSGTLAVGKSADFAVWDAAHPSELAYAFGGNAPRAVFFRGSRRS